MSDIILTKKQLLVIQENIESDEKLKLAKENWEKMSQNEKQMVVEIYNVLYPGNPKLVKEAKWYNLVGDILGIVDPTGIVDIVNGISYFSQGDHLFGLLSLISAIPYAGDVVAKPVLGALKIGSGATKGLRSAMNLAKAGKTAEASVALAKLAEKPGVVGKFLQTAKNWVPKVISKVELLPGGVLKGFKKTIIDYLKLLENASAKSVKFQKATGNLAKYIGNAAKPAENIKALQNILKNEKIFSGLTKRGPMSQIFLGGAPRLFGDRRMRILMRQTKWWLGFLDYIGVANFVGPDELSKQMNSGDIAKKMEEYNKTDQARQNAESDFGGATAEQQPTSSSQQSIQSQESGSDPLKNVVSKLFGNQIIGALI
jgi:hypothetical protein